MSFLESRHHVCYSLPNEASSRAKVSTIHAHVRGWINRSKICGSIIVVPRCCSPFHHRFLVSVVDSMVRVGIPFVFLGPPAYRVAKRWAPFVKKGYIDLCRFGYPSKCRLLFFTHRVPSETFSRECDNNHKHTHFHSSPTLPKKLCDTASRALSYGIDAITFSTTYAYARSPKKNLDSAVDESLPTSPSPKT